MFYGQNFTFDGKTSAIYGVQLVDMGSEILNEIGVKYSRDVARDEGSTLNPTYTTTEEEPEDVVLNLVYAEENKPKSWNADVLNAVKSWLITDYFAPFVSEDFPNFVYYFKCSSIIKKLAPNGTGILEVTFKPLTHFAYKKFEAKFSINSSSGSIININNPSHLNYRPIIEFKNLANVSNSSSINEMQILNVGNNETIVIDNEMLLCNSKTGVNKIDCLLKDSNGKVRSSIGWIELKPGGNALTVKGYCEVTVKAEFPVLL